MNKILTILALLLFSCKPDVIEVVKDVVKPYPGTPIDKKKLTDEFDSSYRNAIFIYINQKNQIFVDDTEVDSVGFKSTIKKRMADNPKSTVSLKLEGKTKMSTINNIHRWLKDVKAFRISYEPLNE